jgi:hypothetical protein
MSNATFLDVTRRRFLTFASSTLAGAVLTATAPVLAQSRARQATSKTPKKEYVRDACNFSLLG